MPRGDKSAYTDKQKRQAEHIEKSYEKRGLPKKEAQSRAWATENKTSHGGRKSGSGVGRSEDKSPAKKGGKAGRQSGRIASGGGAIRIGTKGRANASP